MAAYEMMVVTPAIQNLIRENKTYRIESSIQTGRKDGMFLLDETLFRLWKSDVVAKEDCLGKASKPAELAARILAAERGEIEDEDDDDEDEDEDDDEDDDDDDDDDEGGGGFLKRAAKGVLKRGVRRALGAGDDDD